MENKIAILGELDFEVLILIQKFGLINQTDLRMKVNKKTKKEWNKGWISKRVNKLIDRGLLVSERQGRTKQLVISNQGRDYTELYRKVKERKK